jgi:hypothetical protein
MLYTPLFSEDRCIVASKDTLYSRHIIVLREREREREAIDVAVASLGMPIVLRESEKERQ